MLSWALRDCSGQIGVHSKDGKYGALFGRGSHKAEWALEREDLKENPMTKKKRLGKSLLADSSHVRSEK